MKLPACAICLKPIEIIPPVNKAKGVVSNSSFENVNKENKSK
jgi:hypothetical protein